MSKVWGNIGAWAADAERAEAEEKEATAAAAAAAVATPPQSYPSLKEAVSSTKGKKKTKMTLQEFTMAGTGTGGLGSVFEHKGLTPEEMMRLPTGPKERSAEEMQYGRLGGGFSSYGGGRTGGGGRRDREPDNRRSYGGFDDDRRTTSVRNSEYEQPSRSRADEVDNWAMTKKTTSFDSGTRPNRYSSVTGGGVSRADEIDNWTVNKRPIAPPPPVRSSNFGSGFRDSVRPEQPDRWSSGVNINQDRVTERRRLVLDPPKGESSSTETVTRTNKPNPFGNARPREEILAEKGLDWRKADLELEAKRTSSRPTSSHSTSRPGSAQSGSSVEVSAALQGLERPRPKVNPFGDAKPREVLLQEKGVDYRKIDLELERRRLGRPDTEVEKSLKGEIYNLKLDYKKESNGSQTSLHDKILEKERELELLTRELDDKLRFAQKTVERPGSGAGRVGSGFQERPGSGSGRAGPGFYERPGSGSGRSGLGFYERPGSGSGRAGSSFYERPGSGSGRAGPGFYERPGSGSGRVGLGFYERPPSQSGSFDESRSVDFSDRPRSHGDFGMRYSDDRRGFRDGMDNRGVLGNRELGRSNSRDRW